MRISDWSSDVCSSDLTLDALQEQVDALTPGLDFLVVDTPGRDDEFAKYMAARANTLVTPMNDSFVDFDLIGQVDPENFKVRKLSFYSELIWEARKRRAKRTEKRGVGKEGGSQGRT